MYGDRHDDADNDDKHDDEAHHDDRDNVMIRNDELDGKSNEGHSDYYENDYGGQ